MTNLVITTFPERGSANVGDLLITNSFVDLARSIGVMGEYEQIFRETPLTDDLVDSFGRQPIFLPGMSISANCYPKLYRLRSPLSEVPAGLIPFGCTWQHPLGYLEHAELASFIEPTRALFAKIAERTGPIAVRDHMAEGIMLRNGIPATTVGDCAWYHLPSRGKAMRRSKKIDRLIVTTPHCPDLASQSIELIDMLLDALPSCRITVSLHSRHLEHTLRISEHAEQHGVVVVEAAGKPDVFDWYDGFDLHIGHRLHGHIGFLRRRIPSILLLEDARSRGFSSSIPVGCFPAKKSAVGPDILARLPLPMARPHVTPDPMAVTRVREFLAQELSTGFLRYIGVSPYLDGMLNEVVIPQLRQKVDLARKSIGS